MAVKLGTKVKDSITGFEGVATARIEYMNGCVRYQVDPPVDKDGKMGEAPWFDEQRLDAGSTVTTGGPGPTPPTREPCR